AFIGGIKAIAKQVEKDPGDLLWDQLERRDRPIELALQGDVEALIPGAGTVKCEIERFLDEPVDVGSLPLPAAAPRMRQHAPDDAVGALAMLDDLFEVAGQHLGDLLDLGAFV